MPGADTPRYFFQKTAAARNPLPTVADDVADVEDVGNVEDAGRR